MEIKDMGDLEKKILVGPLRKAWEFICLQGKPYNTYIFDFLELMAAKEKISPDNYIRKHNMTFEPIEIKAVAPFWTAMGVGYNRFSKIGKEYDAIFDFSEGFGRKNYLGFQKEFFIRATGVKGIPRYEEEPLSEIVAEPQDIPPTVSLRNYLDEMALRENLSFGEYVRKYDVTIKSIRFDNIGFLYLAKKETNKSLKEIKKNYHAITDLKQYPGEKACFGLFREWIIMATGVKLNKKD